MQRHMPIGYKMIGGEIQIDTTKANVVKRIFKGYLTGISTYALTNELTSKKILNANNKPTWNHGSIGKILENVKYLGDELYPQIIDKELFEQVQNRRKEQSKSLGRTPNSKRNQSIFSGKLYCGECGEIFRKYTEHCGKPSEKSKWKCKYYIYKNKVHCRCGVLTEPQIKECFIKAVNQILQNRNILDLPKKVTTPLFTPEFNKLDQVIKRMESGGKHSPKELVALMFSRANEAYKTAKIDDYDYATSKINQAFSEITQLKEFDEELFQEVISKVLIFADKDIHFTLINRITITETYRF